MDNSLFLYFLKVYILLLIFGVNDFNYKNHKLGLVL